MQRLEKLSALIFPSDPTVGHIGSIELNLWLAQISGVPLVGLKRESLRLRIFLVTYGIIMTAVITFFYTCFEFHDLMLSWKSLDAFAQNICLTMTHLAGIIKNINTFYRYTDIRKSIEKLQFVTKKYVRTEKQRAAFFRGEFENKIPLTIYAALVGFTGLLGCAMLFYNPKGMSGQFPYRVRLPNWLPYKVQLVYMGTSVLIFALQIVSIDYLNVTLINQIRFQLHILHFSFEELMSKAKKTLVSLENDSDRLKSIIEHHCILIEIRNEVEAIFSAPVLIQFFTSLVIFALTVFQATVHSDDSTGVVLMYFYCCCILCELFVYCWFGNAVFEQSKTLATSGYSVKWYKLDQRNKKSLIIFMMNAQRPFLFTAGGFLGLSLPSFASILSKSYSFIAVLHQLYGGR